MAKDITNEGKFREAEYKENWEIYGERLNLTKRYSTGNIMSYETYCENVISYRMLYFFFRKNSKKSYPHYHIQVNYFLAIYLSKILE
jgi:hypothetical protein